MRRLAPWNWSERARRWLYGLTPPVAALAVAYGLTDDNTAALWVVLAQAVLLSSAALPNTTNSGRHASE